MHIKPSGTATPREPEAPTVRHAPIAIHRGLHEHGAAAISNVDRETVRKERVAQQAPASGHQRTEAREERLGRQAEAARQTWELVSEEDDGVPHRIKKTTLLLFCILAGLFAVVCFVARICLTMTNLQRAPRSSPSHLLSFAVGTAGAAVNSAEAAKAFAPAVAAEEIAVVAKAGCSLREDCAGG